MDIVEYVEKVYGVKLFEPQKEILRKWNDLRPEDIRVTNSKYGGKGLAVTVPIECYKSNGLEAKIFIVDDISMEE